MRFQGAILVPLCLAFSAWSQITYTLPVIDSSDRGSPVAISGTATFMEVFGPKSVASSGSFRLEGRNLSDKSILLLLAYFDEAGPNGREVRHVIRVDHFFWGEIAPGASFVLAHGRSRRQTSGVRRDSLGPAADPKAEITVQYVQFADGSTFGSEIGASDAHRLRTVVFHALQRLDAARGQAEFRAMLAKKIEPDEADVFLETFRHTQTVHGTKAARAQVHTGLVVAEGPAQTLPTAQTVQIVQK